MSEIKLHQELHWRDDFFVPLARKFVASIAVAVIVGVLIHMLYSTDMKFIQYACIVTFLLVLCWSVFDEFLKPQLEEKSRLFQLGARIAMARINNLESQLAAAHEQIAELTDKPSIASPTKNGKLLLEVAKDSHQLIKWHYGGHSTKRADCSRRGMGQQRWQRAREMLTNAGIFNSQTNEWHYVTFSESANALQVHYKKRTSLSTAENVYTPL